MGKTPEGSRPGLAAGDVHAIIRANVATLKANMPRVWQRGSGEFPELDALLQATADTVAAAVPRFVVHKGHTYWLRVRQAAQFDIFANEGDAEPLLFGTSFSSNGRAS